jgi:hypothetical protein
VAIVQFAATEAVTARFEVAVAASVLETAPIASAAVPAANSLRAVSFCLNMFTPERWPLKSIDAKVAVAVVVTEEACSETVCCAAERV